ncbi:MAG: hypothetical protein AAGB24_04780 [Bacteroidota bacterium]
MKAHTVSFFNALLLIIFSSWGYFSSDTPSFTALIPAVIGVLLLLCNKGVKNENKVMAHIAVVLTLLVLIGLVKPLTGAIARNDFLAVARVTIMLVSTAVAMVFFVKSFIDARKARQKETS